MLRAHQVVRAAFPRGVPGADPKQLSRVTNALNEVWRFGPYIVRINPHPGATRLQREARLLAALPPEVRAPRPVAAGSAPFGEWMVAFRLPGTELARAWHGLDRAERRRSTKELAHCMEALHSVTAPGAEAPGGDDDCPHPLPLPRLEAALAKARDIPGVDPGVIDAAAEKLHSAADALDGDSATLVHGDLHLENVLTSGGGVSGVLDFEWCRPGPADLDLDVLLHSIADPALHVESGDGNALQRRDFDDVVRWLRAAYPALFAHPRLPERLWVYRLAYEVQSLVTAPRRSGAPVSSMPQHHPYQRVVRLVEGRSDIGWFVGT
ncbi:MAG TPA: aminoglycoside phosphotransferase family protein [Acidimicrobiales bacterium]|nr:aminoglycoside phosphotransferase family protein [Acidimicrobiales bacterium]